MPNKNLAILMGHLGRDPETRFTQGDRQVTSFSLCTNHNYKQGDDWKSDPTWHNIVCWGKQSEIAAEQFRKGDGVYIEGRIQNRKYQVDGLDRYISEVVATFCWKFAPGPVNERRERRDSRNDYSPPPPEDEVPF